MRSLKFIFTLVIIGCMAFTSCKKKVDVEQLSLIPNTAAMVMEIDGREILKKSGMDKPDDYQFLNIVKMTGGDTYTFVEALLTSSKNAGVSIDNILMYSTDMLQQDKTPSGSAFFKIVDRKAFEGWMKKFGMPEPKETNGIRYVSTPDFCMAWNDNLLNFSNNGSIENLASLFTPKEDGLLATNKDFKQFVAKKSDTRMWIHYGSLAKFFQNLAGATIDIEDFKEITLHSYSNFKDGKVEGLMSFYPVEAIAKIKKKYPVIKEKFDTQLLKDMPEQSYLAFNFALNVPEYFKILKENAEPIINMLRSNMGSSFKDNYYTDEFTSRYDELNSFLDSPELKTIIDALGGDALFSIHGFNQGMLTYPLASLNFTVNSEESFKNMLKLLPEAYRTSADGYYHINIQKLIPLYFAYKNNKVIVSTDLNTTQEFIAGTQKDKNFSHNPIGKLMASKMVFNLNLDIESYPTNIKLFLQNYMGSQFNMFTSFMEIYENMYFSSDENFNIEFVLNFKNKNVNSLKQFFKSIDKIAWNQ